MTEPAAVASAQGIDVSSFQVDLVVHDLSGFSFAFTKATDGLSITDPNFVNNWAAIRQAGIHRGAYHELQAGHPAGQAAHFLAVVRAQGVQPGDMLAVVASDYPGVTDAEVLTFCDAVKDSTRGLNPVLAYTDLNVGAHLDRTSAAFPLWVAWPPPGPGVPVPMPLAGWQKWHLWQWGTRLVPGLGHVDADAFGGTAAEMDTWIASFKPKPPPPPPPLPPHAAITAHGDTMFYLPAKAGDELMVPIPVAVLSLTGPVPASVLRVSAPAPVKFEYQAPDGAWQPLDVDANRSPQALDLMAAVPGQAAIKIRCVDSPVQALGDFA